MWPRRPTSQKRFVSFISKVIYLSMPLTDRFVTTSSNLRENLFFKSICLWPVPFLRGHKVHTASQQAHKNLQRYNWKPRQSIQGSPHIFHAIKTITVGRSFRYT